MDSLNHYNYANANPINFTDPTGLFTVDNRTPTALGMLENWYTIKPYGHSTSFQDRYDQLSSVLPLNGLARSETLLELTISFGVEALNTAISLAFPTNSGSAIKDIVLSLFTSALGSATAEAIIETNDVDGFSEKLSNMTPEDFSQYRSDVENEFMNDFYDTYKDKYNMEILDGQLNVSMLDKYEGTDNFKSDFANFKKEQIKNGKIEYIIVEIPKSFSKTNGYEDKKSENEDNKDDTDKDISSNINKK